MAFVFIYVTTKNTVNAERIARHLIQKKFVACANIFPITSIYSWKGKIRKNPEIALILKTTKTKAVLTQKEIARLHPYDVPCISILTVSPNAAYGTWIREQVR